MAARKAAGERVVTVTRRYKLERKTCPVCRQQFDGTKRAVYCSFQCQQKAYYARHQEQRQEARMERYRRQRAPAGASAKRSNLPPAP